MTLDLTCVGAGVSKVVTVDVKGSWQRWLKVRDLTKGATYTFSVQARTVGYGPVIQANVTAQPVQGTDGGLVEVGLRLVRLCLSPSSSLSMFSAHTRHTNIWTPWTVYFRMKEGRTALVGKSAGRQSCFGTALCLQ